MLFYIYIGFFVSAAQMATEAVGKSNLLKGYHLKLFSDNGKCQADSVMKVFIGYIMQNHFKQLVGILGNVETQIKMFYYMYSYL